MIKKLFLPAIIVLSITSLIFAKSSYYKSPPLFHMWPDENSARYNISRIGPIGIGLDLVKPAFTMRVSNVEPGSPADGKLKKGQYIDSINGVILKDEDPRIILGNLITKIEATDGVVRFMVKDKPNATPHQVIVNISILGPYNSTWPLNCDKSEKIVRNFADLLASKKDSISIGIDASLLFMLSTGEEKDLQVARGWVKKLVEQRKDDEQITTYPWFIGYGGPGLCEYYLRTGDESVIPIIEKLADSAKRNMYNGAWGGRNGVPFSYMGGGHMNAAGVHVVTFLLLAKECGAYVDEYTLLESLKHFYRFAGRGNVAYGDGLPEGGFVDNGKTGGLAFTMSAAANLIGKGEDSVYAKARDISATKSFYSTSWMFHGHTGGGIGEIWRGTAMGLVKDKRPKQYRSFMDERRWVYELARTHEGDFGWPSGWNVSYTDTATGKGRGWGGYIPLVYTVPRKALRIYGAPKTKYSKTYQLPQRPWGTAADDAFYSLTPGQYKLGNTQDISKELIRTDASAGIMKNIGSDKVSDEVLMIYAHHIDNGIRMAAARAMNKYGRDHLILKLLRSKDPRARHAGSAAIAGQFKGRSLPADRLTNEMIQELVKMINDPEESWWCVHRAMEGLRLAPKEVIARNFDRLAYWLEHEDWWLRKAAMTTLTPIAADKRFYRRVLPVIGEMISNNTRAVAMNPVDGIVDQLKNASPEIQRFGLKVLSKSYSDFPTKITAHGGVNMNPAVSVLLNTIAYYMTRLPGGFDELYVVSRNRYPDAALSHKELYLRANPSSFGPKLKKAFKPIIINELIPEYIGNNINKLNIEINVPGKNGSTVDGLINLYRKAGFDDYEWKLFGPARDKIKWDYYSFDPKEKKPWEGGWRYRSVTWPAGMENWYEEDFNSRAAGFKTGYAPFAHKNGKLEARSSRCSMYFCECDEKPNTFWEKEVIMMRTEVQFPPVKEGHSYRLLVGGRSHVNAGDGSDIWINGKRVPPFRNRKGEPTVAGVGKREGGKPWGVVLTKEFLEEFDGGTVTIAATGFLKKRGGTMGNYQTFWLEEMKLPELTDDIILNSTKFTNIRTTEYFKNMDLEKLYRWPGEFVSNPKILGSWKALDVVAEVKDFNPEGKYGSRLRFSPFRNITFKDNAKTDNPLRFWTNNALLDLSLKFASRMVIKNISGSEYLFIESGKLPRDVKEGFKPEIIVLKRQ